MDVLAKQSRETKVVIGAALLYLLFSFFHWQSVDTPIGSAHVSEWEGIGVVAGLLVIALLLWEAVRLYEMKVELGTVSHGLISLVLAVLLLVFTVITFVSHDEFRKWPAWAGLILSIVITAVAWKRGQDEGVQMPDMSGRTSSSASSAPPEPPSDAPPSDAPPSPPNDRETPTV